MKKLAIALVFLISLTVTYGFLPAVQLGLASGDVDPLSGTAAAFTQSVVDDIIVDDVDAVFAGSWGYSTYSPGYYADGYRFHYPEGGSNTATWTAALPVTGSWEVYAMWTEHDNRATDAPYMVYYNGGAIQVRVNQQTNGGQWFSLGVYDFVAGSATVVLSDAANGVVIADAIKFVHRLPEPPVSYLVDLISEEDNVASANLGSITFDGTGYSLPDGVSVVSGVYSIEYNADSGYEFDYWMVSGDIAVTSISEISTTVTVSGEGTLKAVYQTEGAQSVEYYVLKGEFHIHTNASDGVHTPSELVQMYYDAGFDVIAITDHDTIDGVAEAKAKGEELGIIVIQGEEISCNFSDTQPKHIIALFIDEVIISSCVGTDIVEPIFDLIHEQNALGYVAHPLLGIDYIYVSIEVSKWGNFLTSTYIDGWEAERFNTTLTDQFYENGCFTIYERDYHKGGLDTTAYNLMFCLNQTEAGVKEAFESRRIVSISDAFSKTQGTPEVMTIYNQWINQGSGDTVIID